MVSATLTTCCTVLHIDSLLARCATASVRAVACRAQTLAPRRLYFATIDRPSLHMLRSRQGFRSTASLHVCPRTQLCDCDRPVHVRCTACQSACGRAMLAGSVRARKCIVAFYRLFFETGDTRPDPTGRRRRGAGGHAPGRPAPAAHVAPRAVSRLPVETSRVSLARKVHQQSGYNLEVEPTFD